MGKGINKARESKDAEEVGTTEIRLVDRDKRIPIEIDRWRVCQGRHIKELAGFEGQRACDRRLRKLIQAGYVKREKILYGVAGIYSVTAKGAKLEGLANTNRKIRIEQIRHDIAVIDTAIYFNKIHEIPYSNMKTEIELHRQDGFGIRKHRPDFVFRHNETTKGKEENKATHKTICVEIELALKSKGRFENIIKANFMEYDRQIWVVPDLDNKIAKTLEKSKAMYPNIEIIELGQVQG